MSILLTFRTDHGRPEGDARQAWTKIYEPRQRRFALWRGVVARVLDTGCGESCSPTRQPLIVPRPSSASQGPVVRVLRDDTCEFVY